MVGMIHLSLYFVRMGRQSRCTRVAGKRKDEAERQDQAQYKYIFFLNGHEQLFL
jgi:hypothetical protein